MPRALFNVLVYLYIKTNENGFVYALLRRSDHGFWHGVAGGGEDDETPLEAARRETHEEAGIPIDSLFIQLDTVAPVPVTEFSDSQIWSETIYVIPQYCFGVLVNDRRILLSHEHTEYRWLKYQEARDLVKFDDNKTALWELDRKLRGLGPRD
jgi:dATP pyrophosphohydrolase